MYILYTTKTIKNKQLSKHKAQKLYIWNKIKELVSNHKAFDSHSFNMNPMKLLVFDNIDFKNSNFIIK